MTDDEEQMLLRSRSGMRTVKRRYNLIMRDETGWWAGANFLIWGIQSHKVSPPPQSRIKIHATLLALLYSGDEAWKSISWLE